MEKEKLKHEIVYSIDPVEFENYLNEFAEKHDVRYTQYYPVQTANGTAFTALVFYVPDENQNFKEKESGKKEPVKKEEPKKTYKIEI